MEIKELVVFKESTKMTNQEAWDSLFGYGIGEYGNYGVSNNHFIIPKIKSCMLVLDKCPSVKKETIDQLERFGSWTRIYRVNTTQVSAEIRVNFDKRKNRVEMNCYISKGQVILN